MEKIKVGIIGCGNISSIYLKNLPRFEHLEVAAVSDIDMQRARKQQEAFQIPAACTVEELLANPAIELVVNLTIPAVHAEVCRKVLEAGKHVYVEKPLAIKTEDGEALVALAKSKGLLIGSAPDTFLGGGIQTCRKLIDDGAIGTPVAATAFMMSRGHEHWHPDPEFYYLPGGGPMLDMGPYYVTALVCLLGPVRSVSGLAKIGFPQRTITSKPKFGQTIEVQTPTHVAGLLDFESGAAGTIITSFDIKAGANLPNIEIYGSEGTLRVPDPNNFGGPVLLKKADGDWQEVPLTHGYTENWRGLGPADLASAIRNGATPRAGGGLSLHVLEIMNGFFLSSDSGRRVEMRHPARQPEPLAFEN